MIPTDDHLYPTEAEERARREFEDRSRKRRRPQPQHGASLKRTYPNSIRKRAAKTTTTVVHCKREPYDIYIGRPSKWGNPFVIGADGTREEVIRKYRMRVMASPELMAALPELRGKRLGCWCKPLACHGDVLAELADREVTV